MDSPSLIACALTGRWHQPQGCHPRELHARLEDSDEGVRCAVVQTLGQLEPTTLVSAVAYSYVGVPPPTDFYERAKLMVDLKAALVRLGASSGRGQFLSTAECAKACEYVAQLESIRFLIICVGAKCLLAVDSIFSSYKFMNAFIMLHAS